MVVDMPPQTDCAIISGQPPDGLLAHTINIPPVKNKKHPSK
jgi:hypothetical protein